MLVLGFTWAGKRKGVQSSGPIFLFWFLLTISWSITLYHQILVISDGVRPLLFLTSVTSVHSQTMELVA